MAALTIKGPGAQSEFTERDLARAARAVAKQAGARYVRHWIEVGTEAGTVRLRVEANHPDHGIGIFSEAL